MLEKMLMETRSKMESSSLVPKFARETTEFSSKDLVPSFIEKAEATEYKERKLGRDVSNETVAKEGGSYKEVFTPGEGDKKEVHHMPANDINGLNLNDGPAIKMDKEDHRETASCGNSREAREYRETQKELIEDGKFREALQMDIDDIHEKFGDKYDEAIEQMLQYVDELEAEGVIR